jgi:hypothetical protein
LIILYPIQSLKTSRLLPDNIEDVLSIKRGARAPAKPPEAAIGAAVLALLV